MTRREKAGQMMADSIIEMCHMMYNAQTAKAVINACIKRLEEGIKEIQPKKANLQYKEARYGK